MRRSREIHIYYITILTLEKLTIEPQWGLALSLSSKCFAHWLLYLFACRFVNEGRPSPTTKMMLSFGGGGGRQKSFSKMVADRASIHL